MAPKKEIELAPLVVVKRGRGRPRKNDVGESSNAGVKRGRGRPPKVARGGDGAAAIARSESFSCPLGVSDIWGLEQLPNFRVRPGAVRARPTRSAASSSRRQRAGAAYIYQFPQNKTWV